MRNTTDVPALVTGLILLGFGSVSAWLLVGHQVIGPPTMWFASILMVAGIIGLVVSLSASRRRDALPTHHHNNKEMTTGERNPQ